MGNGKFNNKRTEPQKLIDRKWVFELHTFGYTLQEIHKRFEDELSEERGYSLSYESIRQDYHAEKERFEETSTIDFDLEKKKRLFDLEMNIKALRKMFIELSGGVKSYDEVIETYLDKKEVDSNGNPKEIPFKKTVSKSFSVNAVRVQVLREIRETGREIAKLLNLYKPIQIDVNNKHSVDVNTMTVNQLMLLKQVHDEFPSGEPAANT